MDEVPPGIPGRERYWLTHRNRVHKASCGYVKNQHLTEWVAERGRSAIEIEAEARKKGKIVWWCFRCFPQTNPSPSKAPHKWTSLIEIS